MYYISAGQTSLLQGQCGIFIGALLITKIFCFFGHRSFIRNNTQTAVTNMTIKRMLENKNSFNLTFRMFRQRCMSKLSKRQVK